MSKSYRVKWEIDVEADSPELAALEAINIQRDPKSTATVFDCVDSLGFIHQVDLLGASPCQL